MRQQKEYQRDLSSTSVAPKDISKAVGDLASLTNGERRIIRNYRAMERVAQETLEEMSEEFARTLPALDRQDLATVVVRG